MHLVEFRGETVCSLLKGELQEMESHAGLQNILLYEFYVHSSSLLFPNRSGSYFHSKLITKEPKPSTITMVI